jgi:hypothetical protein
LAKRTNTTKSTISRRAAIAGAVAITMSAAEAGAPDPIFPVLERFGLAQRALSKTVKATDLPPEQWLRSTYVEAQSNLKDAYTVFKKARLDLLTTMPTMRTGLAALLVRLGQGTDVEQTNLLVEAMCWEDEPTQKTACTVLNRLAALVLKIA